MSRDVILLPTYNERENVQLIIPELFNRYPAIHVHVIDDNSPDGTADVVRSLMNTYPHLSLLLRSKKEGLGVAYRHGMQDVMAWDDVARVLTMDADGSHDVSYVGALLEAAKTHDLVIGSRYRDGGGIDEWESWRFALSRYGNLYARLLTGLPLTDLTAGFVCYSIALLRKINLENLTASGYAFQIDIKYAAVREAGARVVEVPIVFKRRREGESKISRHIISEGLLTTLKIFLRRMCL